MEMDAHSRFRKINDLQSLKTDFLIPQRENLRYKIVAEEARVRQRAQRARPNPSRLYKWLTLYKESLEILTANIRAVDYCVVATMNSLRGSDDTFLIGTVEELEMLHLLGRLGIWTGHTALVVPVDQSVRMSIQAHNNPVYGVNLVDLPAPDYTRID